MPNAITKYNVWRKGKYYGTFKAPYQIKAIGVDTACKFCPALTKDGHSSACAANRANIKAFKARAAKKAGITAAQAQGLELKKSQIVVSRMEPGETTG